MTLFRLSLLALCLVVISGCGYTDVAPVTGTVTLDGQPLKGASITFQPENGRPSYGGTDQQGNYKLFYSMEQNGAAIGPCTVTVSTATEDESGKRRKETIPKKYFDKEKIKVSVEAKANRIDLKLTTQ